MLIGRSGTLAVLSILSATTIASQVALAGDPLSQSVSAGSTWVCVNGYSRTVTFCKEPELAPGVSFEDDGLVCINGYRGTADACAAPEWPGDVMARIDS